MTSKARSPRLRAYAVALFGLLRLLLSAQIRKSAFFNLFFDCSRAQIESDSDGAVHATPRKYPTQ